MYVRGLAVWGPLSITCVRQDELGTDSHPGRVQRGRVFVTGFVLFSARKCLSSSMCVCVSLSL